ncbi:carboxymuconolactone decarboxylase family protein [Nocardioides speluncae]|uniref:carboxymuconolactone decarboxylase family protein n=1 Tax=Nocardioides speluncae TaxID=2670337 RepID=UPI000D68D1B2|nr:hypothetical protein [Nocardioides speluncae]
MKTTDYGPGFLGLAPDTEAGQQLYAEHLADRGYVTNISRLWAHAPALYRQVLDAGNEAARLAGLDTRDRAVVITAMAMSLGDSYCALVWGDRLAEKAGEQVARDVLRGDVDRLPERDRLLADWARRVTADPNATVAENVAPLRRLGLSDAQILALTTFAALRRAFASVNDALGLPPDDNLVASVHPVVREQLHHRLSHER